MATTTPEFVEFIGNLYLLKGVTLGAIHDFINSELVLLKEEDDRLKAIYPKNPEVLTTEDKQVVFGQLLIIERHIDRIKFGLNSRFSAAFDGKSQGMVNIAAAVRDALGKEVEKAPPFFNEIREKILKLRSPFLLGHSGFGISTR